MERLKARPWAFLLFALFICVHGEDVDLCKRQPFRGRCPPTGGGIQTRSQFVLRYYVRNGECVSYPYGHCANDDSEPKLHRYKEECEEECLNKGNDIAGDLDVGRSSSSSDGQKVTHEITYATAAPRPYEKESSTAQYETPKTECQRQRDKAKEGGLVKGGFVPQCMEKGDFQPLQCEPDGQVCFCVNTDGIEMKNSRCQPGEPKPDCDKINSAAPMRSNECTGGADNGPCRASIPRWFYDESAQICKKFQYSGCGGNGNNYASEQACQRRCVVSTDEATKCANGKQPLRNSQGGLVNCAKTDCETGYKCSVIQKISICCPDTEKSANAGDQSVPKTGNICHLPKVRGPCDQFGLRYYYDKDLNECKYFFYGGCEGNANNFERKEDCDAKCATASIQKTTSSDLDLSTIFDKPTPVSGGTTPEFQSSPSFTSATLAEESSTTGSVDVHSTRREEESTTMSSIQSTREEFVSSRTTEHFDTSSSFTSSDLSTFSTIDDEPGSSRLSTSQPYTPSTDFFSSTTDEDASSSSPSSPSEPSSSQASSSSSRSSTTTVPILPPPPEDDRKKLLESSIWQQPQPTLPPAVPIQTRPPTTTVSLPPNRCQHPRDEGGCGGQFVRWFWNHDAKICEQFSYTGCNGNGNNFASREECLSICHVEAVTSSAATETVDLEKVCDVEIDVGPCTGIFMRYAFDKLTKECKQFQYGGCGGNGNNFPSAADCKKKCLKDQAKLSPNICEHTAEAGECTGTFSRFAYDAKSNECRQFTYGGCGGNGNNFATVAECKSTCVKVKCGPKPECDTSRCQLVKDAHGCSFCSCPPPPRHPPITSQGPPQIPCPHLDVASCVEPCIVFLNRRGCNECVCPLISGENGISLPRLQTPKPEPTLPPFPPTKKPPQVPVPQPAAPPKEFEHPAPPRFVSSPAAPSALTDTQFKHDLVETESPIISLADLGVGRFCTQPLDPGPCSNFVQRWYFNSKSGECETFLYGGCAGNRNHFFTRNECYIHCARFSRHSTTQPAPTTSQTRPPPTLPPVGRPPVEVDDTCVLPPDAGPCVTFLPRWYFNSQTGKCDLFSYGGCQGNKNNFVERTQCEAKCQSEVDIFNAQLPVRCTREKDEGFGGGYSPKWYYNQRNLRCEQMVYQGKGGNDNQFSTLGDCNRSCKAARGIGFSPQNVVTPPPVVKEEKGSKGKSEKLDIVAGSKIAETGNGIGSVGAPAPSQPIEEPRPQPPVRQPTSETSSGGEYKARPIVEMSKQTGPFLPVIGASPPATIDYVAGKRLPVVSGVAIHAPQQNSDKGISGSENGGKFVGDGKIDFESIDKNPEGVIESSKAILSSEQKANAEETTTPHVPICPNGLNAMQYTDGRPVMCLPGKNQCPDKSVCYFNGMDFFCCPNEDDPYDQHIFGGYDGEEVKHGYKNSPTNPNIRAFQHSARRSKRSEMPQTSFSIDSLAAGPTIFDGEAPQKISRAGLVDRRVSPCLAEKDAGQCGESHLRYFYDIKTDVCRLFYYSGCGGNSNNFATQLECDKKCKIGVILNSDPPPPPGRCPNNKLPLGDTSPVLCGNRTDSIGCPAGFYCRMGPPDVCCPVEEGAIDLQQILNEQHERMSDVRRKPFINAASESNSGIGEHSFDEEQTKEAAIAHGVATQQADNQPATESVQAATEGSTFQSPASLHQPPPTMCPDGNDALLKPGTNEAISCGAGFDGHELCPKGYYCSMDPDRNVRLCCPFSNQINNVPTSGANIAPYFGQRNSNPGEVVDRGSLPSDPKPPRLNTPAPRQRTDPEVPGSRSLAGIDYADEQAQHNSGPKDAIELRPAPTFVAAAGVPTAAEDTPIAAPSSIVPIGSNSEFGRMIMQPDSRVKMGIDSKLPILEHPGDEIWGRDGMNGEDPFENKKPPSPKSTRKDKSTCFLRPNDGRQCKEGETSPVRSYLQFFYSAKDRLCKVFFYRGCGGNQNRFESKKECEQYCIAKN